MCAQKYKRAIENMKDKLFSSMNGEIMPSEVKKFSLDKITRLPESVIRDIFESMVKEEETNITFDSHSSHSNHTSSSAS